MPLQLGDQAIKDMINKLNARRHALSTATSLSDYNNKKNRLQVALNEFAMLDVPSIHHLYGALQEAYSRAAHTMRAEEADFAAHRLEWQTPPRRTGGTTTPSQPRRFTPPSEKDVQDQLDRNARGPQWYDTYVDILYPKTEPMYMRPAVWFGAAGLVFGVYYYMEKKG